jgi:hypothetical protein
MRRFDSFSQEHPGSDHILSVLRRLRLDWLLHHFPQRLVRSLYVFVNGFITIGVLALLALVSRNPFVFPSLGPTAYLLFFSPLAEASSPRNTIFGHAIGLICGYAAFAVTGAETLSYGPGLDFSVFPASAGAVHTYRVTLEFDGLTIRSAWMPGENVGLNLRI